MHHTDKNSDILNGACLQTDICFGGLCVLMHLLVCVWRLFVRFDECVLTLFSVLGWPMIWKHDHIKNFQKGPFMMKVALLGVKGIP